MFTRIRINAFQIGLAFKNNKLIAVLTEGAYWLRFDKYVHLFDTTVPFVAPAEMNTLLHNDKLAALLQVVEVADNEIVLQFTNGNFTTVLTPGRYAFWKGVMQYEFTKVDVSITDNVEMVPKALLENQKMKYWLRKFTVANSDKALLYIDGKLQRELTAGTFYFWNNSVPVEIKTADTRQQQLEISGQELLTKDKAALRINFFVSFRVTNIVKALTQNKDFEKQLYLLMQLGLRAFVGNLTLDELLATKDSIGAAIIAAVADKASDLGLAIADAGIRDVILPGDMKDIMNQVLVAEKKAQANTITRREEAAATRSLLNTAKLMEENEMLFKLKEMEYVEKIADKINSISLSGGNVVGQLKEIFCVK